MSKWYAAHVIMFVELKDAVQGHYPIWENIVLIQAETEELAFEKAERCGMSGAGDEQGRFRWGNKPARWVFAGVRKLTECAFPSDGPADGVEITFTELQVDSRAAVERLTSGDPVQVCYSDRYRPPTSEPARQPKRRRKQA